MGVIFGETAISSGSGTETRSAARSFSRAGYGSGACFLKLLCKSSLPSFHSALVFLFFVLDICKVPAQKKPCEKTVSANFAEYSVECKVKTCRVALKNRPQARLPLQRRSKELEGRERKGIPLYQLLSPRQSELDTRHETCWNLLMLVGHLFVDNFYDVMKIWTFDHRGGESYLWTCECNQTSCQPRKHLFFTFGWKAHSEL